MAKIDIMMDLYSNYLEQSDDNETIEKISFKSQNIDRKIEILKECLDKRIFISQHPEYYLMYDLGPDDLW